MRISIETKYRILQITPSGNVHAWVYEWLRRDALSHQDELIDLMESNRLGDHTSMLLVICGGLSLRKEHNIHLLPMMARLRERYPKLSTDLQMRLDWQLKTHGW